MFQRRSKRRLGSEVDINLVPIMDVFVALIPFLLLTAAFMRFSGVNVHIPTMTSTGQVDDQSEKLQLTFQIEKDHILVSGFTHGFKKNQPEAKRLFTIQELRKLSAFLEDLHGKFIQIDKAMVHADASVPYQDVMRVLDAITSSRATNGIVLAAGGDE